MDKQEAYLKQIQGNYLFYCDYVHNHHRKDLVWIPSRFHRFICESVQSFVERETEKAFEILIINCPPQHGKSESVTATFPSWFILRNPDKNVIQVSYGDDLARKFGLQNLNKVREFGYIFGREVDPDKHSAMNFGIKGHSGGMKSAGYGAGITGNPADLIIIDDPVKNRIEADSETNREIKWNDFEDSIKSRLSAGGKIILIMTRWHEDDLAGRLVERYPEYVEVLNLPCEAEEDDLLGRKPGEPLCPEIGKDAKWLKSFKESHTGEHGARSWNALYQGRPTAREGNMLKREWWQFYDREEYKKGNLKFDTMLMSVDAAFKDEKQNDYVAISVWGKKAQNIYLVDMVNEHLNFTASVRKIRLLKARHPKIGAVLIEDKANGPAIIQVLREQSVGGIVAVRPDGSKEARVQAVSFSIEAGNVYLPEKEQYTWDFIEQCASFPNGKHDDMVDSMSQALSRLVFTGGQRERYTPGESRYFNVKVKKSNKSGFGERINVI